MVKKSGDPLWRDRAAVSLAVDSRPETAPGARVLVIDEATGTLAAALTADGAAVTVWNRRVHGGAAARAWPPAGPFDLIFLRLPRAREELRMVVRLSAALLAPDGALELFGANDEGVRSAVGALDEVFAEVETVLTKRRCRLISAARPRLVDPRWAQRESWRREVALVHGRRRLTLAAYPGMFAYGRLDPGTALLHDSLPWVAEGARVLDYGCGDGIIARLVCERVSGLCWELLDNDALALVAAAENVPGARTILGDRLAAAGSRRYDLILGNPPVHRGKADDFDIVSRLLADAPAHLCDGGAVVLVVQGRTPLEKLAQGRFGDVAVLADAGGYRVWRFARPV